MKPSKPMVLLGLAVAVACALGGVVALKRHSAQVASVAANHSSQDTAAPAAAGIASAPAVAEAPAVPPDTAAAPAVKAEVASPPKPPVQTRPVSPPPASGKGALQDPVAREALGLVGVDPKAEAYWIEAINDAKLSAHERQDLIEDLNEDGLSDPKHPSPQDLPVILNRLALIEALAPSAMDDVNFEAFREAYKDLLNLAEVALGGGEPVN